MRPPIYLLVSLALLMPLPARARSASELLQRGVTQLQGGHRLEARSSFGQALSKDPTMQVAPGRASRRAAALLREVRAQMTGTLVVRVKRSWGDVYLDGRRVGRTPFSGAVTVGRHRVEVRKGDQRHAKSLIVYHRVNSELYLRDWPRTPGGRLPAARPRRPGAPPIPPGRLLQLLFALLQYWLPS